MGDDHAGMMSLLRRRHILVPACVTALAILLAGCATTTGPVMNEPPGPLPPPIEDAVPTGPATLSIDGTPRQGGLLRGLAPAGTRSLTLDGDPVAFDEEGNFIIAFDRDAPPAATLVATLARGTSDTLRLDVAPGNWRIERVNAPITGSASTEEFRQRRAGELARIEAARARSVTSDGWRQPFIWPVRARISGLFGSQRIYRGTPGSYHSGLDLAGGAGTVYVAPADGVVVLAATDPFTLEGNLLIIDHGMGLNSAFLHNERLLVKEGDRVRQGQPIGVIGATGRVTGPHLHWSMKWHSARIDPLLSLPATDAPGR
jgi:murein DD-endopeptidase MepM/ murein hydrolase activator NlpD